MLTIGFAKQYYTLWDVSAPYKKYGAGFTLDGVFSGSYHIVQDCRFIQNLSMDFEQAKAKVQGPFNIDLDLRGHSTWTRETGQQGNDIPVDRFPFGNLMGELIAECSDVWQLNRTLAQVYQPGRRRVLARRRLIELGELVKYEGEYVHPEAAARYAASKANKVINGHIFNDGEKVTVTIKEVDSFSFDTKFGTTYVCKYLLDDGRMVKYMGSNPSDISKTDFVTVKATVKHSEYNGQQETKLQRIKVLSPVS